MGIFLIALLLVQGLQLPLQKKCVIMLAFGLRLPYVLWCFCAAGLSLSTLSPCPGLLASGSALPLPWTTGFR